ncbi:MAG: hypothetical protein IT566_09085 [Rhodospirillaceae bacterium]|nr:hypothetical protein [Rhodospirillaceae bacterium]
MTARCAALIALFLLSACGEVGRPFLGAPQATANNPLIDIPTAVGIAVVPVRGLPDTLNMAVSRATADRLQALEIPAEAVPANAGLGFTLEGTAETAAPSTAGHTVSIFWVLKSRRGAVTGTHRQNVLIPDDAWQKGDGPTTTLIGGEAATAIAALLGADTPVAASAGAKPAVQLPTVSVKAVEGAPGDGRESLRLAVIQILNEQGVRRDDVMPDITLTCAMNSKPAADGLQQVEIVWQAKTKDGADLGTMRLDNTIPNGALDGPWGPTAFAIADAARADLMRLITSLPAGK